VAAASHRHQQVVGTGEVDCRDDIGGPGAAGDERRVAVDHAVPDFAGVIVALVARTQEWATQACLKFLHRGFLEDRLLPCGGDDSQLCHSFPPESGLSSINMTPNS
jgi:hypothetical protein